MNPRRRRINSKDRKIRIYLREHAFHFASHGIELCVRNHELYWRPEFRDSWSRIGAKPDERRIYLYPAMNPVIVAR